VTHFKKNTPGIWFTRKRKIVGGAREKGANERGKIPQKKKPPKKKKKKKKKKTKPNTGSALRGRHESPWTHRGGYTKTKDPNNFQNSEKEANSQSHRERACDQRPKRF